MKKIEDILIKILVWVFIIFVVIAEGKRIFVIQPLERDFYTTGTAVHQLELIQLRKGVQDDY